MLSEPNVRRVLTFLRLSNRHSPVVVNLKSFSPKQLAELIDQAQQRKKEMVDEQHSKLRDQIVRMIKVEGLSVSEVLGLGHVLKKRRRAVVKYKNPANHSDVWTGRGRRPLWFVAALDAGKKEEDLRV